MKGTKMKKKYYKADMQFCFNCRRIYSVFIKHCEGGKCKNSDLGYSVRQWRVERNRKLCSYIFGLRNNGNRLSLRADKLRSQQLSHRGRAALFCIRKGNTACALWRQALLVSRFLNRFGRKITEQLNAYVLRTFRFIRKRNM